MQNESKNKVINRNASLFQQLKTIHKWINQDEHQLPKSLSPRQEEQNRSTVLPSTANKLFRRKMKVKSLKRVKSGDLLTFTIINLTYTFQIPSYE